MPNHSSSPLFYEIHIEGALGELGPAWFEGLQIRQEQQGQQIVTILSGPLPDQPALHGVLNRIRDLNLTLLSVKRLQTTNVCK